MSASMIIAAGSLLLLLVAFFISSTRDQYAPRPAMEAVYRAIAGPKQLIWIEAQDHFFEGALDSLEEAVYGLT